MAKILVADDEQKIREVIREYSEFNGHEVTEAADGMTAVGLCKLNDYDLIIMDIMMPKLDGFSACKEKACCLRRSAALSHGAFSCSAGWSCPIYFC